jgi:lipoprotein-releasing system ATP-binding protein
MNNAIPQAEDSVLSCQQLTKKFHLGPSEITIFNDLDFRIRKGERVAIIGVSGSGKSTLLHILGGLDNPDKGKVFLQDQCLSALSDKQRCELRNRKLGFVYQFHHILPEFTVLENVCMPLLIRGVSIRECHAKAKLVLEQVGLAQRMDHKLAELSGGERQRTAIARALVTEPECVLADEPTGNLDLATARQVFDTLLELNQRLGTSILIVTHDFTLASKMDRVLRLQAGKLTEINPAILSAI